MYTISRMMLAAMQGEAMGFQAVHVHRKKGSVLANGTDFRLLYIHSTGLQLMKRWAVLPGRTVGRITTYRC
jgi:hypothetical protein